RQNAAGDRSREAAFADAGIRETCARRPGARDLFVVVVPDGALPVVCEGVEDQPQPLPQPGLGHDMARQGGPRLHQSKSGWTNAVRPSRPRFARHLRMRYFFNAVKAAPHREKRPKGTSRRTHASTAAIMTATLAAALFATPAIAGEEPKYGGTLTYMIPADAPPSFDGHRESTFATVHPGAPFYSERVPINPEKPSPTTHIP